MKRCQTRLFPVLAASFLACGNAASSEDPKAPNEKNFEAAISQYFEKKGELCLGIHAWPVTVSGLEMRSKDTFLGDKFNQMEALASVGLVRSEDKNGGRGYFLTDAAKPFLRGQDLCWGKKRPTRL